MTVSGEIIKILEYLCDKIGLTIDWTSNNVLPYLEQLCGKFIKWEISTSIMWIVIMFISTIAAFAFSKIAKLDGFEKGVFWFIALISIIVVGVQAFDIIQCCTFPEKAIYDYINFYLNHK